MFNEYDAITAEQYASFRPNLHDKILKKCFSKNFSLGLDIGCGTGHSSIALSKFCNRVIALDPSTSMIEKAIENSNVEYHIFDGTILNFESNNFDIITFAGSLHYAKSQQLLDEIIRVTTNKGLVVVYDFEMLLADILKKLKFKSDRKKTYDHEADFSGLQAKAISLINEGKEVAQIEISPSKMAHLLLSVKEHYRFFEEEYKKDKLHQELSERLTKLADSKNFFIKSNLFFKVYEISI